MRTGDIHFISSPFSNMNYEAEILEILTEAGCEGLTVKKISQHVFNLHNNLFDSVSFNSIYNAVFSYVQKNSKSKNSILQKLETRGVYRINSAARLNTQLKFDFQKGNETCCKEKTFLPEDDLSLSLFDE